MPRLLALYNVPISKYFATLFRVRYSCHSYIGEITWCKIFWWFYRSPSSSLGHSSCFFEWVRPPFCSLDCCFCILEVFGIDHSYICHSFPTWWLPYFFRCNNTCWNRHFLVLNDITRCPSHVTRRCSLSCPTLWKLSGSVLPLIVSVFGGFSYMNRSLFPF